MLRQVREFFVEYWRRYLKPIAFFYVDADEGAGRFWQNFSLIFDISTLVICSLYLFPMYAGKKFSNWFVTTQLYKDLQPSTAYVILLVNFAFIVVSFVSPLITGAYVLAAVTIGYTAFFVGWSYKAVTEKYAKWQAHRVGGVRVPTEDSDELQPPLKYSVELNPGTDVIDDALGTGSGCGMLSWFQGSYRNVKDAVTGNRTASLGNTVAAYTNKTTGNSPGVICNN